ncbi:MAG: hypothetical protein COB66_06185 [Coxiella sp. (in: Bacteria)]|nr:MAG: hypothetical protein COB66_06185 [Coxiella sp. (in: g-proteobacteria)]
MRLIKHFKIATVFILCGLLAACGFHSRGQGDLPPQFHTLYFHPKNPYEPVASQFKNLLQAMGVRLVDSADQAAYSLNFSKSQVSHNSPSITNNAQATTLNFRQSIRVSIESNKTHRIIAQNNFTATLNQLLNQNQIMTANTSAIATRDLPRTLVSDIFLWLSTQQVHHAFNSTYKRKQLPTQQ